MNKLSDEIIAFINSTKTPVIVNPDGFPLSPFTYIYLVERKLVIHLITLDPQITNGLFFQHLSIALAKQGLKIIHLWEDVWYTKQAIVKSRILSLLGKSATIPARLTTVRRIDKALLDDFLTAHHLQSSTTAKFKYGLFLPERYFRVIPDEGNIFVQSLRKSLPDTNEILVAVASFSGARTLVRDNISFRSYELIRFANIKGFTIVGGFDKLLKAFVKEQQPDDIMTYADADWSDGTSYEKLGFERIELTPPHLFYLDKESLVRVFDKQKMINHENEFIKKVWSSGSWKYLLKLKSE